MFFSWFLGSALRMVFGLVVLILLAAVVFVGVNVVLAFSGGPGPCTPGGGAITVDAANSQAFEQKWDTFDATLGGGSSTSVNFNESEISSRTQTFLDENDAPFSDARVCIHDGFGEGTATLDAFLGLEAKIRVKGNLDLTGQHPVAQIDDIEAGNVPGWLTGAIEGFVEDAIENQLDDIDLEHTYTPTLTEGNAKIDGQP